MHNKFPVSKVLTACDRFQDAILEARAASDRETIEKFRKGRFLFWTWDRSGAEALRVAGDAYASKWMYAMVEKRVKTIRFAAVAMKESGYDDVNLSMTQFGDIANFY